MGSMGFMKIYESRFLIPAVILITAWCSAASIAAWQPPPRPLPRAWPAHLGLAGAGVADLAEVHRGPGRRRRVYCMIGAGSWPGRPFTLAMGFIGLPRHLAEWIGSLHLSPFAPC